MATRLALILVLLSSWMDLDANVQQVVQSHRTPLLEVPMHEASAFWRSQNVLGGLLALAIFGGPSGVETARYAILVLIPTNIVVEVTKRITHRTRPDGESNRNNAGFPSGHAANAFALAWVLWRRWPRAGPYLFACAAVVAYSRMYLNRHFFSDVLVGAVIGLVCAFLVEAALKRRAAASLAKTEAIANR